MERLILLLLGLNLRKTQDGISLDFEYSSNLLKKCINFLKGIFGEEEGNAAAIHLKNMYNISAPGFFTICDFNKYLSDIGISVVLSEIKTECNAVMMKMDRNDRLTVGLLNG